MKLHKSVPPSQICTFLGIELDSLLMEVRLDASKLALTLNLLENILQKTAIKRRDFESVAGKLNWIAKVVYSGRTFLRRIIDAIHSVRHQNHFIPLSGGLRADLQWYADFLPLFNGKNCLVSPRPLSPELFSSDASSTFGYGAFLQGAYLLLSFAEAATLFPDSPPVNAPIHVHEFFALLVACRTLPDALSGLFLCCYIDNQIVVSAVNKGSVKGESGPLVMQYLRDLFWLSARYDFRLTARYISSTNNVLSDALSRGDWPLFRAKLRSYISTGALY
jgi:hypothetical protein